MILWQVSNMVDILSGERCLRWWSRCSTRRGDLVSLSFKEGVSLMFSNMLNLYIWAIESVTFKKVLPSDEVKNVVDGAVCWTIYEKFWKVGRRRCRHHCKALFSSEFSSYTVWMLSMLYSFKNLLETVWSYQNDRKNLPFQRLFSSNAGHPLQNNNS